MTDEKILAQRHGARGAAAARARRCACCTARSSTSTPTAAVDWDEEFLAGLRHHGGVGPLALHPSEGRADAPRDPRDREPVRERDRPPHRAARSDRRAPIDLDLEAVFEAAARTGHGDRGELPSGPSRPQGRAHPVGAAPRCALRDRHRRARRPCTSAVDAVRRGARHSADGSRRTTSSTRGRSAKLQRFLRQGAAVAEPAAARHARSSTDPRSTVAPDLLGRVLVRVLPDGTRLSGRDRGGGGVRARRPGESRHSGARTPRNATMFGPPGRLYVYFTYGHHWMMNVVTRPRGRRRAPCCCERSSRSRARRRWRAARGRTEPRDLCSGPGKLCQALGVDRHDDGADLVRGPSVWLEAGRPRGAGGDRRGDPRGGERGVRQAVALLVSGRARSCRAGGPGRLAARRSGRLGHRDGHGGRRGAVVPRRGRLIDDRARRLGRLRRLGDLHVEPGALRARLRRLDVCSPITEGSDQRPGLSWAWCRRRWAACHR